MTRTLNYTVLLIAGATLLILCGARPSWLGDDNEFLRDFINHEFLNVLGVILAITLASTANIHLALNRIEEYWNAPGALSGSRSTIKKASYWLIGLFTLGVVVVVVKPIAAESETSRAFFNAIALVVLLWHVLLLINLTEVVFRIQPNTELTSDDPGKVESEDSSSRPEKSTTSDGP